MEVIITLTPAVADAFLARHYALRRRYRQQLTDGEPVPEIEVPSLIEVYLDDSVAGMDAEGNLPGETEHDKVETYSDLLRIVHSIYTIRENLGQNLEEVTPLLDKAATILRELNQ